MDREQVKALKKRLGANIRLARLRRGLTQEEAAELIGISTEVYGRLERGGIFPRVVRLTELCEHLKASADELLELSPPEKLSLGTEYSRWQNDWFTITHRIVELVPRLSKRQRVAARRQLSELYLLLQAFVDPDGKQPQPFRKRRKHRASSPRP
jgi:transcriptional regulator with XRE-family HTH domain